MKEERRENTNEAVSEHEARMDKIAIRATAWLFILLSVVGIIAAALEQETHPADFLIMALLCAFPLILGVIMLFYVPPDERREKRLQDDPHSPWRANLAWRSNNLTPYSGKKPKLVIFTAVIWNMAFAVFYWMIWRDFSSGEVSSGTVQMLFLPVAGAVLLLWSLSFALPRLRFGPALLEMDPFPGALGGHVGGSIVLNRRYDPQQRYSASLALIEWSIYGGEIRRLHFWEAVQTAHAEADGKKRTRLVFHFETPPKSELIREPDEIPEGPHCYWQLHIRSGSPFFGFSRRYRIPVYEVREKQSRHLPEKLIAKLRQNTEVITEEE